MALRGVVLVFLLVAVALFGQCVWLERCLVAPRDLALVPIVLAVVTVVLAAYATRLQRLRYNYVASGLVLVGLVVFGLPNLGPVDPNPVVSTDRISADENGTPPAHSASGVDPGPAGSPVREGQPVARVAKGKDVYFKIEGLVAGPPAPNLTNRDYPLIPLPWPFSESRIVMWVLAQQHLYFGAFVLGALFWIMGLELRGALARKPDVAQRNDRAAQDVLGLVVLAVSGAAISGAVLLLAFVSLYPDLAKYLIGLFRPFVWLYGLLFVVFSLAIYLYYYLWQRMSVGFSKWMHVTLGVIVNVIGNVIMMISNSWGSFMTSPAGVDERGQFLGDYAHVLHNALWKPLNVHRFASHLIFGAVVIAAYAGYRTLKSRESDERTHYDWVCHIAVLALFFALATVPFGGYWLHREFYAYRQQMGITMVGGLLAWINIILVILMGLLFVTINYYLWRRVDVTLGGSQYRSYTKWIFVILTICFVVYMTPHTLVMRAAELKAIGGQQHPIIGNYGVESSKQPAVNMMIAATMSSLSILWRSRYDLAPGRSKIDAAQIGLFLVGSANIIWLGIMGYYIPANVRVGLSVPMVMTTLHIIVAGALLTYARAYRAEPMSPRGRRPLSWGSYLGVLVIAAIVTWLMGIGGYMRSSVRLFWHAMEIFRDQSPWAFTHTIGLMGNVIAFNALLFWAFLIGIIWLKQRQPDGLQSHENRDQKILPAAQKPASAVT